MADYTVLDKLLHRVALGLTPVAEMSFDIDQKMTMPDCNAAARGTHLFISGLARAGSTVLMRRFYVSGVFRSLIYRDMPFVLAPNLWIKMAGASKKAVAAHERAHGDALFVDADSPESLDEVFWRIFAGDDYIRIDRLVPHEAGPELRTRFTSYIGAILAQSGKTRYLSKNNNNILRLPTLRATFPQALIVVPFRDPMAHAGSLLNQHRNFMEIQRGDHFVRCYMTWLAHHEFGEDHRPFSFYGMPEGDPNTLNYWADLWVKSYSWLIETAPSDAIFVSYEALCADSTVWMKLAARVGIAPEADANHTFKLSRTASQDLADHELAERAEMVHTQLKARAAMDLGVG